MKQLSLEYTNKKEKEEVIFKGHTKGLESTTALVAFSCTIFLFKTKQR
jgi:hypothetical protein